MRRLRFISLLLVSVLCLTGCQESELLQEYEKLKVLNELEKQNEEVILKLFEVINEDRDISIYDELCDSNYLFYSPSITPNPKSLNKVKEFAEVLFTAFPDAYYDIKDVISSSDKVIVWYVFKGTHKSEYMGIPPTNNEIAGSSILMFKLKDSKIIEEREEADFLGMMSQMGMELKLKQ